MEQLLTQFLEHLRYERNVSEHTLRNLCQRPQSASDHQPAHPQTRKRSPVDLARIDHITIREWLSHPFIQRRKRNRPWRENWQPYGRSFSLPCEGLLELNPAKLVSTPRLEKRLPQHLQSKKRSSLSKLPTSKLIWESVTGQCWN